jgi:TP901 family phage tail tape measure protein
MRSVKVLPNSLDYSKASTSMQLAIQKQQIFNKLLDSGTTKLLNFGKNTQWAGRQLMVGFTIPLAILGSSAIRTFKDMEMQAIRFKKVYGDMFTATSETDAALENIKNLATEFTKYGISVADTIKLAADAAAAGNSGKQLESVVTQATKLSVLGGVAQEQALDATIAIQNAFRVTGKELEDTINFLNAVENQTVVALDDITQAIPKVAPVIRQLGGDIKDLAFFMAAMQEGGVKASEAANALKSGLASLINPSKQATKTAAELGINLQGIVDQNAGDLRMTVMSFANALQPLEDLQKARLIEQIFGKYQFARISTLFDNVARSGNQASRVLDIANESTEALAMTAERELGVTASSSAIKFQASIEKLKASLVPAGQAFAEQQGHFVPVVATLAVHAPGDRRERHNADH